MEIARLTERNESGGISVANAPAALKRLAELEDAEQDGRLVRLPCKVGDEVAALFYMKARRKVDLTNLLEALDDVLVAHEVLEDDNSRIIVSHDGSRVRCDSTNPRTEVTIRFLDSQ